MGCSLLGSELIELKRAAEHEFWTKGLNLAFLATPQYVDVTQQRATSDTTANCN